MSLHTMNPLGHTGRPERTRYQRANDTQEDLSEFSEYVPSLGKPEKKSRVYPMHIATAATSLVCLALSILATANESISWHLGVENRQLIVIGFLLGIMNLCLSNVGPLLFLLLEARFGESTIRNYDALLRNSLHVLAPKISFIWRVALSFMLVLPLGLSIAYKTFTGGESSMVIRSTDYTTSVPCYGMFKQPLGIISYTGVPQFLNATASLRGATKAAPDGSGPPLPAAFPQPYGQNILILSNKSAAVLDTPHSDYVFAIQNLLNAGESWAVNVPVVGAVAVFDESGTQETYQSVCEKANRDYAWYDNSKTLYNNWFFIWANQRDLSDQSTQYVGFAPEHLEETCEELSHYVDLYNVDRRRCVATWSVSRGGIQLRGGSCDTTALPWAQQQNIKWNNLGLESLCLIPLVETLSEFTASNETLNDSVPRGNESAWKVPYVATSVAAMLWSRIGTLQPDVNSGTFDPNSRAMSVNGTDLSHKELEDVYLISQDDQTIAYNRQTLRKSPWLYLVLAAQPILTMIFLGIIYLLYSTPVGDGFNLISVLSGVDRRNLGSLSGASLSGQLVRPIKLIMNPAKSDGLDRVTYRVVTSPEGVRSGELTPNFIYH